MSALKPSPGSSRRDFLAGATFGAAGIAPMCCRSTELDRNSWVVEGGILRIDLAREQGLRKTGEAKTAVDLDRKVNILVVQYEKGRWAAVDRTCTHGGAMCAYQKRSRTLRCTSLNHAEYTLEGKLLHGRTHGNLRSYAVKERAGWLEIELEKKA
jgi:nitrite reductase/ring-hydroxylating ferredoxin subunit